MSMVFRCYRNKIIHRVRSSAPRQMFHAKPPSPIIRKVYAACHTQHHENDAPWAAPHTSMHVLMFGLRTVWPSRPPWMAGVLVFNGRVSVQMQEYFSSSRKPASRHFALVSALTVYGRPAIRQLCLYFAALSTQSGLLRKHVPICRSPLRRNALSWRMVHSGEQAGASTGRVRKAVRPQWSERRRASGLMALSPCMAGLLFASSVCTSLRLVHRARSYGNICQSVGARSGISHSEMH
jgi:hypothetical protein